MSPREPDRAPGASHLGQATLQALKGTLSPSTWTALAAAAGLSPVPEEIVERRDGPAALLLAWSRTLQPRIDDAVAEDAVAVVVADGSSLSVADAERFLAAKEERRVYPTLRTSLARARAPLRRFTDRRSDWRRAVLLEVNDVDAEQQKKLTSFLASSTGEMTACREALASLGGVPLEDDSALARGLDLPDPAAFSDQHVTGLVRLCLPALPNDARPLQRVAAPRRLAGHVVDVADPDSSGGSSAGTAVRLLVAPTLSAGRFAAVALGAGRALAAAAHAPSWGPGLGLALCSAEVRRGLDESKGEAARAARVVAVTLLLRARLQAAVALVACQKLDVDEEREVARAAVRKAVDVDGGLELATGLLLPPLPDGRHLHSAEAGLVDAAVAAVDVASSWLLLRDQLDAGFLLRPRVLAVLRELPSSTEEPALAWRRLLGEIL